MARPRRPYVSRSVRSVPIADSRISKTLGTISAILFVLGNILVFYPNPVSNTTCYRAAPMLWWGVMTVTGVGWILFGQVFFVVVVVGLGGQAVLVSPITNLLNPKSRRPLWYINS
jgi:hypothetical protein